MALSMSPSLGKLLQFFGLWVGLWLPVAVGVLVRSAQPLTFPVPPERKVPLLLPLYGLAPLLIGGLSGAAGWRAGFAGHGLAYTPSFALAALGGALFGVGSIATLVGLQWRMGGLEGRWTDLAGALSLGLVLGVAALATVIGLVEELVFRGFVLDLLAQDLGWGLGAGVACGLFAVLHLVWDGPAGLPSLPGLVLMGGVLTLARWATGGSLGLATGLHGGWVFALALADALPLTPTATAPGWLMGWGGQPLTSALTLGLLLLCGLGLGGWIGLGGLEGAL